MGFLSYEDASAYYKMGSSSCDVGFLSYEDASTSSLSATSKRPSKNDRRRMVPNHHPGPNNRSLSEQLERDTFAFVQDFLLAIGRRRYTRAGGRTIHTGLDGALPNRSQRSCKAPLSSSIRPTGRS